jgi:DNA mismatch repair protein MutL
MAAYDGIIKTEHKLVFLYLSVPPNTIDINIHPTKTEIKFDDEHAFICFCALLYKNTV